MFSKATKTLLRNYIRHTGTHNKILEESDMWRLHEDQKHRKRESGKRKAHMDEVDDRGSRDRTPESPDRKQDQRKPDTFWMKRLHEAEEQDPDRWGHAGYKELHPEEFNSSLSDSSDSEVQSSKKRKKKEKKRKKEKKAKKKKKKKHKRERLSESDSHSESESTTDDRKTKKKCKKRRNSINESSSDSDETRSKNGYWKAKKRKREKKSSSSSDPEDFSDEAPKRQKFSLERTEKSDKSKAASTKSSKHKKKSKHKHKRLSDNRTNIQGNGVEWIEKTS